MVMPGSHDAGMSKITEAILAAGSETNTQNQGLNIYDQLKTGSRFFDMRVSSVHQVVNCCGNYKFWTSHLSEELAEVAIGKTGESLEEVIKEKPAYVVLPSVKAKSKVAYEIRSCYASSEGLCPLVFSLGSL